MSRTLSLTILLAISFIYTSAFAQQTFTLEEAIQTAVKNNRNLKIAELDMQKADEQVREAFGLALPSLNATGDYSRAIKKPVFFLPATFLPEDMRPQGADVVAVEAGSNHALTMGFQATQVLFNSAVFTGVGTAKTYQKASRQMYQSTYQETVANTKRAFYQVLYMRDVVNLTKASFKNAEDNFNNVKILNKQGIVSDYDMIRAEVQLENIRPLVTQSERNFILSENALKMVMGFSPTQDIDVEGDMSYVPVDPTILEMANDLLLQNNASLKALKLQTEVNDEIVTINRSEYLPTLSAYGNYLWQGQSEKFSGLTDNLVKTSQVGLNLSLNLFNGFQTSAKVDAAKIDFMKSEEQFLSTRDAMVTQLQNIRYRIEEARGRIEAQRKTVEQAEKGYKIATTRYSSGSGTQLEVNDADVALMQARVNKAQAIYEHNVAKADLEELLNIQE